ncbi:MAG TPA: hypothetical protein VI702_01285 [Nitrospiria bacterium]
MQVSFCLVLIVLGSSPAGAQEKPLDVKSSTQYVWGDDWLGEAHSIIAHAMRFNYKPSGPAFSITGYGRGWKDFTESEIRDDGLSGRLYYLYLNYAPRETLSLRLGRQFINFTAGSALLDGVSLNLSPIGPVGITFAEGADVRFSLDGADSKLNDHFVGVNVRLQNVRATQLGISYVRRYDDRDLSREEFGLNARRSWASFSPYGEVRYDSISETFDEAVAGIDLFPAANLMIKGEYYQSYPTFDATSIYSVFAVDRYREYLLRADYSLEAPVTVFASCAEQIYGEEDHANVYRTGVHWDAASRLAVKLAIDRRTGAGGADWGYEAEGDYKIRDRLALSAGAQYDVYERPDQSGEQYAVRYWVGGRWQAGDEMSVTARFEDNINENFDHRPLGRVTMDWPL